MNQAGTNLAALEIKIGAWMEKNGYSFLRFGIGIVYIWFGALKPFGLSPAQGLVEAATFWIPIPHFVGFLGFWEVLIGLSFIYRPWIRFGILLIAIHLPGTLLPLLLVPEQCFVKFPFVLTLEAQYIIKNLVLGAAAMVIGGKVRHKLSGFIRFAPDEFNTLLHLGEWRIIKQGESLVTKNESSRDVMFIQSGRVAIYDNETRIATLVAGQFVGEMSFLTGEGASATAKTLEPTRVICWDKEKLRKILDKDSQFQHAFMATLNLDLINKLKKSEK